MSKYEILIKTAEIFIATVYKLANQTEEDKAERERLSIKYLPISEALNRAISEALNRAIDDVVDLKSNYDFYQKHISRKIFLLNSDLEFYLTDINDNMKSFLFAIMLDTNDIIHHLNIINDEDFNDVATDISKNNIEAKLTFLKDYFSSEEVPNFINQWLAKTNKLQVPINTLQQLIPILKEEEIGVVEAWEKIGDALKQIILIASDLASDINIKYNLEHFISAIDNHLHYIQEIYSMPLEESLEDEDLESIL